MSQSANKPRGGFWAIAIILLIWNIFGLLSFVAHAMITEDVIGMKSIAEQALYSQYPMWTLLVFALATIAGFVGALLLVMKRKISKLVFTISLLAIIVQMSHTIFMTDSLAVYGNVSLIMPLLVVAIGVFCVWYASFANNKGWLK